MKKPDLAIFENFKIRRVFDEKKEEWYFSVADILGALIEQDSPIIAGNYWRKLKQRLKEEGSEVVTDCHDLKMQARDGKFCLFINSRKPTSIDGLSMRGLEEMLDEIFYIPRKYLKMPRFYEGLYDAIVGENRYWKDGDCTVNPKSNKLEDVYEIIVKSPEQIFILPSSLKQG